MKQWLILALGLLATQLTMADEMEFSISDKLVGGSYDMTFGNNFSTRIGLLHTDLDHVANYDVADPLAAFQGKHEDNVKSDTLSVGLFADNTFGNVHTLLGGKLFYLHSENHNNLLAAALGGAVEAHATQTLFFTGEAYYSPDIITNGDFRNYWDIDLRASFKILRNANLYVGYKIMKADFEWDGWMRPDPFNQPTLIVPSEILLGSTADRTFYDGLYLGIRFKL